MRVTTPLLAHSLLPARGRRLSVGPLSLDFFRSLSFVPVLRVGSGPKLLAAPMRLHAALRWRERTVLLWTGPPE